MEGFVVRSCNIQSSQSLKYHENVLKLAKFMLEVLNFLFINDRFSWSRFQDCIKRFLMLAAIVTSPIQQLTHAARRMTKGRVIFLVYAKTIIL